MSSVLLMVFFSTLEKTQIRRLCFFCDIGMYDWVRFSGMTILKQGSFQVATLWLEERFILVHLSADTNALIVTPYFPHTPITTYYSVKQVNNHIQSNTCKLSSIYKEIDMSVENYFSMISWFTITYFSQHLLILKLWCISIFNTSI